MNPRALYELVAAAAERHPGRRALWHAGGEVVYSALMADVGRIAKRVEDVCPGRGGFVATWLPPGHAYVASALAVAAAGRGFCPIEPESPLARAAQVLRQAAPVALITDEANLGMALEALQRDERQAPPPVFVVGRDAGPTGPTELDVVKVVDGARRAAGDVTGLYLFFTSGSTGEPKGIVGSSAGLLHFLAWEAKELGLDESVAVPQLAPLSFDVSLRDIFVPLSLGGCVCIPSPGARRDPALLAADIAAAGCTLMHCVPSILRLLLDELRANPLVSTQLRGLRYLLLAGEPLLGKDVNAWRRLSGSGAALLNLYGPSETTLAKLFYRIPAGELAEDAIVPLGKAIPGATAHVVQDNVPCAPGEIGEIYLVTEFMSHGYLNLESLNREKFVANPLGEGRAFRTGDLGHVLPSGDVAFNGRKDGLLKIRGNRVELAEVEATLAKHSAVRQVVVVPLTGANADITLLAFVRGDAGLSPSELEAHAASHLPGYMQPGRYQLLESVPLNSNGKVDRVALAALAAAALAGHGAAGSDGIERDPLGAGASEVEGERELAQHFANALRLPTFASTDDFFRAGGSSLSGIGLAAKVTRATGVKIVLADLLRHATPRRLAGLVNERRGASSVGAAQQPAAAPTPSTSQFRATAFQRAFWEMGRLKESKRAYNEPVLFEVRGEFEVEHCRTALAALVARHEVLRTAFLLEGDVLVQSVQDSIDLAGACTVHDLRQEGDGVREVERRCAAFAEELMNFGAPPLFRCHIFQLGAAHWQIYVLFAHIIVDDASLRLLMREAAQLYLAAARRGKAQLPEPVQGCRTQATASLSVEGGFAACREHWRALLLPAAPPLEVRGSKPRPLIKGYAGFRVPFELERELALAVRACAQQHQVTTFAVLVAALAEVLALEASTTDVVLGVPMAARAFDGADSSAGNFLNTVPLRFSGAPPTFGQAVTEAHRKLSAAQEHAAVPLTDVLTDLAIPTSLSRSGAFDVAVTLTENESEWRSEAPRLAARRLRAHNRRAKLDLMFLFNDEGGQLTGELEVAASIFSAERAAELLRAYWDRLASRCGLSSASADAGRPTGTAS